MRKVGAVLWVMLALVAGTLGLISLFVHYEVDIATLQELTLRVTTNPLILVCATAALTAFVLFISTCIANLVNESMRRLVVSVALCSFLVAALGIGWAYINPHSPISDQQSMWNIVLSLSKAQPLDEQSVEYVALYPHQKNLAVILALVCQALNTDSYFIFYIAFSLSAGAWVLGLCVAAYDLSEKSLPAVICAVVCVLFVPLVFYATYLYGTIVAPTLITWSFVGIERFALRKDPRWLVLPALLLWLANRIYSGTLVGTIAALISLVFLALTFRKETKIAGAALTACVLIAGTYFASGRLIDAYFQRRTQIAPSDGAPSTAWIAMGLTSDDVLGEGGWNNLNAELFAKNNNNTAATNQEATGIIVDALNDYLTGKRSLLFFARKTERQWLDPTFGGITMNVHRDEETGRTLSTLLDGPFFDIVQSVMVVLVPLVYLYAAAGSIDIARKRHACLVVVFSLYILGGFAFQLGWEQKSRYCLPYFVGLMPIAALGLASFKTHLRNLIARRKTASQPPRHMRLGGDE